MLGMARLKNCLNPNTKRISYICFRYRRVHHGQHLCDMEFDTIGMEKGELDC